jgi:small subunit ribosomal protein S6
VRDYELVTIWNPDIGDDGVTGALERLSSSITSRGGEVADTNVWGRRRLAYSIKKHAEGIYVVMELKLQPAQASDLESQLRINEDVLRHLLVRKDS